MIIIKIYLLTVLFWFLLIEITGIMFKKKYIKNTDIIRLLKNDNSPRYSNLKTTLMYLKICFIPILRLQVFITKMMITFYPKIIIEEVIREMNKK